MSQTTQGILESLNPRLIEAIGPSLEAAALAIERLDAILPELTLHVETIRHHLAFEIEKATLAIERSEWESRSDTSAARRRLARLTTLLDTTTIERLTSSRDFATQFYDELRALRDENDQRATQSTA